MANRFWVGGTASWDAIAGTKWATTSGGAGGAAVPTTADDVFFDAASGAVTITIAISGNCLSFSSTGFTGTITGTGAIKFSVNCTFGAGSTHSGSWDIAIAANGGGTITPNGKSVPARFQNFISSFTGTWTLAGNLTCSGGQWDKGTVNLGGFNLTCSSGWSCSGTSGFTLGAGTLNCASWSFSSSGTLSAASGTIKVNTATGSGSFAGGGKTYNIVWFTGAAFNPILLSGSNTISELKHDIPNSFEVDFTAGTTQTITTWSFNGSAGIIVSLRSSSAGTQANLSKAAGIVNGDYLNIKDSNATGGATWNAGANSVNSGNNTGWIFSALDAIGWFKPLDPPKRVRALTVASIVASGLITSPTVPAVNVDQWFEPLSTRIIRKSFHPNEQQFLAFNNFQVPPEVITLDKWFHPLSLPPKPKVSIRTASQQFFAKPYGLPPPDPIRVTLTFTATETNNDVVSMSINVYDSGTVITSLEGAKVSVIELDSDVQGPTSIREIL